MKKLGAIVLSSVAVVMGVAGLSACNDTNGEKEKVTVGVLQFAEHSSLDNCYEGIQAGLADRGYSSDNVTFNFYNAKTNGNDNTLYANTIVNSMPDVAVGIATPSAAALASAAEGAIPVVFTAVSDPVGSGFDSFANVTGSSDSLPLDSQLKLIKSFFPDVQTVKIGIVYTLSESNSVSQIASLEKMESEYGVDVVSVGINDATDLATAVDTLIAQGVHCLNNLTDNTVVQNLETELDRATAAKIPVFGSEIEQVQKGCLASCSLDYVDLGKKTGEMIADILDGKKKADDIDYLFITEFDVDYNSSVLSSLGLTLANEYKDSAIDVK